MAGKNIEDCGGLKPIVAPKMKTKATKQTAKKTGKKTVKRKK